jgi:hypothetical protein
LAAAPFKKLNHEGSKTRRKRKEMKLFTGAPLCVLCASVVFSGKDHHRDTEGTEKRREEDRHLPILLRAFVSSWFKPLPDQGRRAA